MPSSRAIVDPRLTRSLEAGAGAMWPSLAAFYDVSEAASSYGAHGPVTETPDLLNAAVPARIAPASGVGGVRGEIQAPEGPLVRRTHRVALRGDHRDALDDNEKAPLYVDDARYDVLLVTVDSAATVTYVDVERTS